ncbi:MAG: imidazoleglycerol-phosphate dehydratase HisB [Planctomycetota bacterium]
MPDRKAVADRETKETRIHAELSLDGDGVSKIQCGVGFLEHMLDLLARHARLDLTLEAAGDVEVDDHHTVEDVGIVLGQLIDEALGDRAGITRFGHAAVPMDEALAEAAIDLSGRGALVFNAQFGQEKVGSYDTTLTNEFFQAVAANARMTLHVNVPYGRDGHHVTEAIFKAFARALAQAVQLDPRVKGIPSTKGTL